MSEVDHRSLLAGLTVEQRRELTTLADGKGLAQLMVHLALVTALAVPIALRIPYWPVLLVPLGIAIIFLFTALHESVHGTAFKSDWLNRGVAHAAGFIVFVPANWFRYFHFAHHRHTQDAENDPELASPRPHDAWSYAWYLSGIPYWRSAFQAVFNNAIGRTLPNFVVGTGRGVVTEARIHIALWVLLAMASIAFGWTWPLKLWIVPALLGQPVLRAFLLAEHAACPAVSNMLENSRTTITSRLVRFLCWNMSFHAAHHTIPTVPFHRTQELTYLIARQLEITSLGYIAAHREIRAAWTDHDADTEAAL